MKTDLEKRKEIFKAVTDKLESGHMDFSDSTIAKTYTIHKSRKVLDENFHEWEWGLILISLTLRGFQIQTLNSIQDNVTVFVEDENTGENTRIFLADYIKSLK